LFALALPAHADSADPVAVQVGTASVSVHAIEQRLAAVPDFQRRTFGKTPAEVRRHFVDALLVPELLYAEDARIRNLAATPRARLRIREALARAVGESLRLEALAKETPDAELRAYYDANHDEYEKPERIRIFRILVDDEALATRILGEAAGSGGPLRWTELARDHSLDAATKLRSGALGFVLPDGRTDVPQVAVDPAIYAAASKVKDGELVPAPVKEGSHLAVVWRRGTLAKVSRPFEGERETIRALLARQRAERALAELREQLRKSELTDENPALLESLPPDSPPAGSARPASTGSVEPAQPIPKQSERGLR
jgi:peptidyl-prolyl cis-trans isomerase C